MSKRSYHGATSHSQNNNNVPMLVTGLGSSVVRAFAHGAMGRRIDLSWGGPIELFLVPASAPRLFVTKAVICVILSVG